MSADSEMGCEQDMLYLIWGFKVLKSEELRLIFTAPSFLKEREPKQRREFYIPRIGRERTLQGSPFEVRLRNQLTQKAIAIERGHGRRHFIGQRGAEGILD